MKIEAPGPLGDRDEGVEVHGAEIEKQAAVEVITIRHGLSKSTAWRIVGLSRTEESLQSTATQQRIRTNTLWISGETTAGTSAKPAAVHKAY